ncbi:unnamed protein product [Diatraea saccharalis]|uniref:Natalisin n=1 Tax=Diatraea saccharalis TaxID=40085 RepID=A0A9N9RC17_9NEOP|nr:unnamed protein product [Diatraea saccharalis]
MLKKLHIFLLIHLVLSTDIAFGNSNNKTKLSQISQNKYNIKSHTKNERPKRALPDVDDHPFWPNRGKKKLYGYSDSDKETFWANRGRRDSSIENYVDFEDPYSNQKGVICKNCYPGGNFDDVSRNIKHTREDVSPFWGMRGRRDSDEREDDVFWGSRGRREDDDPFWGNRGRRQDDGPFWGNRGRREEEPFWGNRGRREATSVLDSRERRENDEPFWGNRGRRDETLLQKEDESFWGNRGRRKVTDSFWGSQGIRKQDLKESILNAINVVENDIQNLSRLRENEYEHNSLLPIKLKEKLLRRFLNDPIRPRFQQSVIKAKKAKSSDPGTFIDNKMYAEQPHYIVVERSSRSSAEDDPFFISRGKKYYLNFDLVKAARDRRGAIEEIVKSVRNDPYYIARGKKDTAPFKKENSTLNREELSKVKELICATIELIETKNNKSKTKRDVDSERDRRTTLQKLAAQLQMDPYFVSRGKKNDESTTNDVISGVSEDNLEDFINEVASKCN